MPANPWPPGISEAFTSDAFSETPQEVTIRTEMDTGPPKVRRRFFNPVKTYECNIVLRNATEYATLRDFYYITCQGGTDTISMPHPITGDTKLFRFASPIAFSALGIAWRAAFKLECLP
ncbi:MAG TPA: hypothetical protein VKE42_09865 [Candidatus Cybelea sp.]|nr:hypothetical protein [Candidatus Cybelea sp.]